MKDRKSRGIRLVEITPTFMKCVLGSCPSIFETDRGTFIIIGERLEKWQEENLLAGKVGLGEAAIEVPKNLLKNLCD